MKTAEVFVLFDISKVSFCLDRSCLAFQDPFFTLDIRIGFLPQCFPPFIDLHYFIAVWILPSIVSIKTSGFILTAAAVCTSVYFHRLGIAVLFFAFRPDMAQFPSIMADVIMLIFKNSVCHVGILSDIFLISSGFPFLMVLKFNEAFDL